MTGRGHISVLPNRRLRLMFIAQLVWLGAVCTLGLWWGWLAFTQAGRIASLEARVGLSASAAHQHWLRMQSMLFWESSTFFLLLLATTLFIFWMYWRDAQRARGLQAFFASVTHELRTPLTSIRLQAESIADQLLGSGTPENDPTATLIGRLLEDTSRLESQVDRTLELARVEGGGSVLTQPLRIKPWLEYFFQTWGQSAVRRIELKSEVEECSVQADPSALRVILKNLFENSIKHSGHKGAVRVHLTSERNGPWVLLKYNDDGEGFKGDTTKLGKLFYRGSSSQGAGVGLYLINALMKNMGGKVEFSATRGFQTTLWFKEGGPAND